MAQAPKPVRDLSWDAERAGALGDAGVAIWKELLGSLASLPVARRWKDSGVQRAVTFPIPDEPMPLPDVLARVRDVVFRYSMYPGHARFMAFITGPGTIPGAFAE